MKKLIALILIVSVLLGLFAGLSSAAEDRVVLTIGDISTRSGNRYDEELGMWQYLAEQLGVEIRCVYLSPEEYAAGLSSGNLPDIVTTQNNLSTILENGVALNADPYLEEYAPKLLQGQARRSRRTRSRSRSGSSRS